MRRVGRPPRDPQKPRRRGGATGMIGGKLRRAPGGNKEPRPTKPGKGKRRY